MRRIALSPKKLKKLKDSLKSKPIPKKNFCQCCKKKGIEFLSHPLCSSLESEIWKNIAFRLCSKCFWSTMEMVNTKDFFKFKQSHFKGFKK